jgi:hypothetical protein
MTAPSVVGLIAPGFTGLYQELAIACDELVASAFSGHNVVQATPWTGNITAQYVPAELMNTDLLITVVAPDERANVNSREVMVGFIEAGLKKIFPETASIEVIVILEGRNFTFGKVPMNRALSIILSAELDAAVARIRNQLTRGAVA